MMAKTNNVPGRKISPGDYSAFLPAALPPVLDWTPRLIGVLSDADRLIGRLAGDPLFSTITQLLGKIDSSARSMVSMRGWSLCRVLLVVALVSSGQPVVA